jgi:hypothetical protein
MGDVRKIPVTSENVWFLQKQISLFDILDFFPEDSIGAPVLADNDSLPYTVSFLEIETDADFSFTTDIPRDKMVFRQSAKGRNGTGKWAIARDLQPGDTICIEKRGDYQYYLYKENGQSAAS